MTIVGRHLHDYERGAHMAEAFGIDGRLMACAICGAPREQCESCREVIPAGTLEQHRRKSAWHRQWAERDWQVRAGLR